MKNRPRIMVFRLKELIYTTIFILLGILLIVLMVYMFSSDKHSDTTDKHTNSSPAETTPMELIPSESIPSESNPPENASTEQLPSESAPLHSANNTPAKPDTSQNISVQGDALYIPGVYTSSLVLSNSSMEIQVCVDADHINSVSIKNMDEAVSTMYPLMENSMNDISNQIVNTQSLENISYSQDSQYTYMILLDAIETTISKARYTSSKNHH